MTLVQVWLNQRDTVKQQMELDSEEKINYREDANVEKGHDGYLFVSSETAG